MGRSKFSAETKKKIASCINSKSKTLGCGGGKKAKADVDTLPLYRELNASEKALYRSDIFKSTRDLVEKSLVTPDLDLGDWVELLEEEIE